MLPNNSPLKTAFVIVSNNVSLKENKYKHISTARFAKPSLIPGIANEKGINVSMYDNIKANAKSNPRYTVSFFID